MLDALIISNLMLWVVVVNPGFDGLCAGKANRRVV